MNATPTRVIYADQLRPGSVIIEICNGTQYCRPGTTHAPGKRHELTVLSKRSDETKTTAIVMDEDGEQHPWGLNSIEPIRVLVAPMNSQAPEHTP